mgnify:FL=1
MIIFKRINRYRDAFYRCVSILKNIIMKVKGLIYCLLAFCMLALSSCGPDNEDYTEKVVGEYNIKITPNISVKYGNSTLPIATETIETTAVVTEKDDEGNVTMQINGVNGEFSELFFEGYCDGLGLKLQNNHYDGVFYSPEYGIIYCDIELKNPTVSIYNSRILNWKSTFITGTCGVNISGLDVANYNVSGSIQFEAKGK